MTNIRNFYAVPLGPYGSDDIVEKILLMCDEAGLVFDEDTVVVRPSHETPPSEEEEAAFYAGQFTSGEV